MTCFATTLCINLLSLTLCACLHILSHSTLLHSFQCTLVTFVSFQIQIILSQKCYTSHIICCLNEPLFRIPYSSDYFYFCFAGTSQSLIVPIRCTSFSLTAIPLHIHTGDTLNLKSPFLFLVQFYDNSCQPLNTAGLLAASFFHFESYDTFIFIFFFS